MTQLYAQPYDISVSGFYFETSEEYAAKASALRNDYGQHVEEFEIQFIDGDTLDAELFEALSVNQCNFTAFLEAAANWSDDDKIKTAIAVGECGHSFALGLDAPDQFDIDLYQLDTLRDLAVRFVDEGLFGEIPASIQYYLDYDAIARDLAADYSECHMDGKNWIYRSG